MHSQQTTSLAPQTHLLLRWIGSKRRLASHLVANLPGPTWNGIYSEPFAGSAALFFAIRPTQAFIGDVNPHVINLYRQVRDRPKSVHDYLTTMATNETSYYQHRQVFAAGGLSPTESAATFLYLNRMCFNGVYRTDRAGRFNVPYGRRQSPLPTLEQLRTAQRTLKAATLVQADYSTVTQTAEPRSLVYLDPPYPTSSARYGEYGYGGFRPDDVDQLIELMLQLDSAGVFVMVTYPFNAIQLKRLPSWNTSALTLRQQVAASPSKRESQNELLVMNYSNAQP